MSKVITLTCSLIVLFSSVATASESKPERWYKHQQHNKHQSSESIVKRDRNGKYSWENLFINRRTFDGDNYAAELVAKDSNGNIIGAWFVIKGVNAAGLKPANHETHSQQLSFKRNPLNPPEHFEVRHYHVDTKVGFKVGYVCVEKLIDPDEDGNYPDIDGDGFPDWSKESCGVGLTSGTKTKTKKGTFQRMRPIGPKRIVSRGLDCPEASFKKGNQCF